MTKYEPLGKKVGFKNVEVGVTKNITCPLFFPFFLLIYLAPYFEGVASYPHWESNSNTPLLHVLPTPRTMNNGPKGALRALRASYVGLCGVRCHLINYSRKRCKSFHFFSEILTSRTCHTPHFVRNFKLVNSIKTFETSKWEDHAVIWENVVGTGLSVGVGVKVPFLGAILKSCLLPF